MILTHINKFFHQKDACEIVTSKDKVVKLCHQILETVQAMMGLIKLLFFIFHGWFSLNPDD